MISINLLGGGFQHAFSSTLWKKPRTLTWDKETYSNSISMYVDSGIPRGLTDSTKLKFGWLLESRFINGRIGDQIASNLDQYRESFECIFTHRDDLLQLDPFFKWCPAYGTYIDDIKVYLKTKTLSYITSKKQDTENHQLRVRLAQQLIGKVDVFGREINPIEKKEQGLCDYAFSIAIENDCYETYFTEKILDCFATGTIPVYRGCEGIKRFFNPDGIIFLESELRLDDFTFDEYYQRIDAIKENAEKVKQFNILDDWLFTTYIAPYV